MNKMLALREWLTISDAAAYLAKALNDPVRDADVIRLGIDGLLQLSLNFVNNGLAWLGSLPNGELIEDEFGRVLLERRESDPQVIDGVWDVMPRGSGEIELLRLEQKMLGGPEVQLWSIAGIFIARPDRSEWGQLAALHIRGVDVFSDIVARGLPLVRIHQQHLETLQFPEDAALVVRVDELNAFISAATNSMPGEVKATSHATRMPAQRAQEEAVLQALQTGGFDPRRLPKTPPGKPSPAKQHVRAALSFSPAVIDNAWKRLTSDKRIAYAT